jgi:rsbT co-antagonist protein RsbR
VSFVAWYDIIAIYRETIRRRLLDLLKKEPERAATVSEGLNRMIDIAMSHLGEAYLSAKEQIITQQQEAIRELSVPVLQIRPQMLILPLVGVIDSSRARQLIESLLMAIRDHRAKGIVIDVTGVPLVDTAVANHLLQASKAAQLMGAEVVITGISSAMAQTLVGLGTTLPDAATMIDLQEGVEQIERALGVRA